MVTSSHVNSRIQRLQLSPIPSDSNHLWTLPSKARIEKSFQLNMQCWLLESMTGEVINLRWGKDYVTCFTAQPNQLLCSGSKVQRESLKKKEERCSFIKKAWERDGRKEYNTLIGRRFYYRFYNNPLAEGCMKNNWYPPPTVHHCTLFGSFMNDSYVALWKYFLAIIHLF